MRGFFFFLFFTNFNSRECENRRGFFFFFFYSEKLFDRKSKTTILACAIKQTILSQRLNISRTKYTASLFIFDLVNHYSNANYTRSEKEKEREREFQLSMSARI